MLFLLYFVHENFKIIFIRLYLILLILIHKYEIYGEIYIIVILLLLYSSSALSNAYAGITFKKS